MEKEKIHIVIFRPSIERPDSFACNELARLVLEAELVDKTVCDDRIVYIFKAPLKD